MSNYKFTALMFVVLVLAAHSFTVTAQPTIQLQPFLSGLSSPVYITSAKDDTNRLFVVEQGGIIKVYQPGSTTSADFMNISTRIVAGGEQGLLGLAFHPQFAANGKFYVYYTCNSSFNPTACPTSGDVIISEFSLSTSNSNQGNPNSERILIKMPHPFGNHNGGMIEFGPDGYLYAGTGDGGGGNDPGNRAQNNSQLLGKMLRIDVTPSGSNPYTIPPSNPFAGQGGRCDNGSTTAGNCQEIYAYGLRNPFRWSFDRGGARQLYAGDVGQGALEEISIITNGGNFGWRVYEGTQCNTATSTCPNPLVQIPPILEYFNSGSPRCSVTGGYVYRGRRNALPLGTYVFSDYCTGEIMIPGQQPAPPAPPRSLIVLLDSPRNVSSFGEDEAGELYVVGLGGTVEKIVNPNAVTPANVGADFDGDLRTDISVFRPSNGTWYILNSFNNSVRVATFGISTDRLVPGDYDGDGKTDIAVFRDGNWYSLDSSNNAFRAFSFGTTGDVPYAGDYDGDRKTDYAIYRQSTNAWYVQQSSNSQLFTASWGLTTDTRVPADYDGDGKTDLAVFRSSSNSWYVRQSSNGNGASAVWGASGDVPVPGDYDGDGKFDFAVWRPSSGVWYALKSSDNGVYLKQWGISTDTPVAGDYDGDGKTDPTVTRSSGGSKMWYITRSSNAFANRAVTFGVDTDANVPNSDVP